VRGIICNEELPVPFEHLDRRRLALRPLAGRANRVRIERDAVRPDTPPGPMPEAVLRTVSLTARRIEAARGDGRPVMMAFGAHTIKNGLAPVLIHMMERGWLTHLATKGGGIIHDWEFAFGGESSEHVQANVPPARSAPGRRRASTSTSRCWSARIGDWDTARASAP